MKVLFFSSPPFFLAHGGAQTLVEALIRELKAVGVEAEPGRWWDDQQRADIIHYVGRPNILDVRLAHEKGYKVVMTDLLDQTASRSRGRLFLQRSFRQIFGRGLARVTSRLDWQVFREVDAMVYAVPHEWEVAKYVFGARADRGHVIPHGLEEEALVELAAPQTEEDYLISAATIHPRKNSVLLAEAARHAQVPVVFLGKPYSTSDPYFKRFKSLVDDKYVRYPGFVSAEEKHHYLKGARGFVLLSQFESGCISAFEASGAGLPLLLSDLPWATKSYPEAKRISFARLRDAATVAQDLREFYERSHRLPTTNFPILSWRQVALRYRELYDAVLRPAQIGVLSVEDTSAKLIAS